MLNRIEEFVKEAEEFIKVAEGEFVKLLGRMTKFEFETPLGKHEMLLYITNALIIALTGGNSHESL